MIDPPLPCWRMRAAASCAQWKQPVRFVLSVRCQSWSPHSAAARTISTAALLTRTSMPPNVATVRSMSSAQLRRSVTSTATPSARPPAPEILAATSSASSRLRAQVTTAAPAAASPSAIARPSPRPEPVTTATLPERAKASSPPRPAPSIESF
jgi:hypothetical protein